MLFQVHLWTGLASGLYIVAICLSGSAVVFRRELDQALCRQDGVVCEPAFVTWLTRFHGDLLGGFTGRQWNGIGAIVVTVLCITGAVLWWPGTRRWWRQLSVQRGSRGRVLLRDLHNVFGAWFWVLILMWSISGIYFGFPDSVNALVEWLEEDGNATPASMRVDAATAVLARLHFGRAYGVFVKALWVVLGLVPCALFVTGALMWWRRTRARR